MGRIASGAVVAAFLLGGCQSPPEKTKQTESNWKPWVLARYDLNGDGRLTGDELKNAVADSRTRSEGRSTQTQ